MGVSNKTKPAYVHTVLWLMLGIFFVLSPVVNAMAATPEHPANAVVKIYDNVVVRNKLPDSFFSFNINVLNFQRDFIKNSSRNIDSSVIENLNAFPRSFYRYPGGLVANRFNWEESIGPVAGRDVQKMIKARPGEKIVFGVDEYHDFIKSVNGKRWYVLNLLGWDTSIMDRELSAGQITDSNHMLVKYLKKYNNSVAKPHYFQLGNELDRSQYQWDHEKYIKRAKQTIAAIQKVDPDARFVAFLRDFTWKYKRGKEGVSRYDDFIRDVLNGLPMVNDFSLHFYYDARGSDKKTRQLTWRLKNIKKAIEVAKKARKGAPVNVWITEHARGIALERGKVMKSREYTSNLGGAVSTGDFLIALVQIPEIKGAFWHGLNAGPWQLFDAGTVYNDLRPRPIYWGLRVLKKMDLPIVLSSDTKSDNNSGYIGGYDIRSAAFTNKEKSKLGLWVVNRARVSQNIDIDYKAWKNQAVGIDHYYIAGAEGVSPDKKRLVPNVKIEPETTSGRFTRSGILTFKLPPASVSSIIIHEK